MALAGQAALCAEQALKCSAQLLGLKDVENKALVERGLSPAQPSTARAVLCHFPAAHLSHLSPGMGDTSQGGRGGSSAGFVQCFEDNKC